MKVHFDARTWENVPQAALEAVENYKLNLCVKIRFKYVRLWPSTEEGVQKNNKIGKDAVNSFQHPVLPLSLSVSLSRLACITFTTGKELCNFFPSFFVQFTTGSSFESFLRKPQSLK